MAFKYTILDRTFDSIPDAVHRYNQLNPNLRREVISSALKWMEIDSKRLEVMDDLIDYIVYCSRGCEYLRDVLWTITENFDPDEFGSDRGAIKVEVC